MTDKGEKSTRSDTKRRFIVGDKAYFLQILRETPCSRIPSVDILEAVNREEALQKIIALPPGAILMDLRLAGENGFDVTRKIKAQYPDIIVVIPTHYDLPEYREAASQSRASHFLSRDLFLRIINPISGDQNTGEDGSSNPKGPS